MLNAKIARERSKNHANVPVEGLLADLQVWIEDACDKGEYSCRIPFPCELYINHIHNRVFAILRNEGYTYEIDESVAGCKYLIISWEEVAD